MSDVSDKLTISEEMVGLSARIENQQRQIYELIRRLDLIEKAYFDLSMRLQSARLQAANLAKQ